MPSNMLSKFRAAVVFLSVCTHYCVAQEVNAGQQLKKTDAAMADANVNVRNATEAKQATEKSVADKKMVQDATISLQTTITGNQEQPKVLYILPWQSPQPTDVDFESLDNQQQAVFNHVERDELRRELETADVIKD